jgi:hypothetical protein
MKKILVTLILSLNFFIGYSQSKKPKMYVDTFKSENNFRYNHYIVIESDTIWGLNIDGWKRYWNDTLPVYIKNQRANQAKLPRTYHKVGQ